MWTLNDTDDMQYRMSQGIDGIITDNPQDLICLNTLLMNAGLVAHWNFDEGIGTVLADNSGNNNSGFIYGANWANGITGGALEFNGSSDYVEGYVNVNDTSGNPDLEAETGDYKKATSFSGYKIIGA